MFSTRPTMGMFIICAIFTAFCTTMDTRSWGLATMMTPSTISDVAKKVQKNVHTALEGMTGFKVAAVNVHVGGISFN